MRREEIEQTVSLSLSFPCSSARVTNKKVSLSVHSPSLIRPCSYADESHRDESSGEDGWHVHVCGDLSHGKHYGIWRAMVVVDSLNEVFDDD